MSGEGALQDAPVVEAVEVWTLSLDRLTPFASANETVQRETHAIVALKAGGLVGWGEAPACGWPNPATPRRRWRRCGAISSRSTRWRPRRST